MKMYIMSRSKPSCGVFTCGDAALTFMASTMEKYFHMQLAIWMMGMMIILATRDLNVTGQAAGTMQVITANML
jgi:hypothetical protein